MEKKRKKERKKKRGAYETEEALMMKRFRSRSAIKAIHRHSNLSVACRRHPEKKRGEKEKEKRKSSCKKTLSQQKPEASTTSAKQLRSVLLSMWSKGRDTSSARLVK